MTDETPPKKKGGKRHKAKGSAFERELAAYFNASLFSHSSTPIVYRTPLSGSFSVHKGSGSADLTGTPDLWVEAKRVERLNFHEAMAQATRGSTAHGNVDVPVVINRRSHQHINDALVVLRLEDFMRMYKSWIEGRGYATQDTARSTAEE